MVTVPHQRCHHSDGMGVHGAQWKGQAKTLSFYKNLIVGIENSQPAGLDLPSHNKNMGVWGAWIYV